MEALKYIVLKNNKHIEYKLDAEDIFILSNYMAVFTLNNYVHINSIKSHNLEFLNEHMVFSNDIYNHDMNYVLNKRVGIELVNGVFVIKAVNLDALKTITLELSNAQRQSLYDLCCMVRMTYPNHKQALDMGTKWVIQDIISNYEILLFITKADYVFISFHLKDKYGNTKAASFMHQSLKTIIEEKEKYEANKNRITYGQF